MRPSRSAKRAANEKIQQGLTAEDQDDSELEREGDSESDLTSQSGDSESEHEESSKRNARPPPAKKAKLSQSSSAVPQTTRSRKKCLSLLPTMPLDVLFEIFGFLPPKDILNLAKTNKPFRKTLLSKEATTVWKTARQRLKAPDCPSDMTEHRWAELLFSHGCQTCSAKNVHKVDFFLRRRVCTNCKKDHLIVKSKFLLHFPDVDISILDLIPATNVGGWAHGHASGSRFYWDSDISDMIHTLAIYEANVHRRQKDAKKKLEDFKAQQRQRVETVESDAQRYTLWTDQCTSERSQALDNLSARRREAIRSKFIALGYTEADISCQRFHPEYEKRGELTERVWLRIRPMLEPEILASKTARLARQFAEVKRSRRKLVDDLYRTCKQTLQPSQWKYLPTTYNLCNFEPFRLLVEADSDTIVTAADFSQCMEILPQLLSTAMDDLKARLRGLMHAENDVVALTSVPALEPGEIPNESALSAQASDDLELATSIFHCGNCTNFDFVIGWEDIATHHCTAANEGLPATYPYYPLSGDNKRKDYPSVLLFKEKYAAAVKDIVILAGFNPTTTLASQMDAADLRFTCGECKPSRNGKNESFRVGYTWRGAAAHVFRLHSAPPSWNIVPESDTAVVKTRERATQLLTQKWTCGHCPAFMDRLEFHAAVVQHVQTSHGIADPQEPDDLFLFERSRQEYMAKYPVPTPHPPPPPRPEKPRPEKLIKCLRCASGKPNEINRRFDLQGVTNHLRAKHAVDAPVKGVDWATSRQPIV